MKYLKNYIDVPALQELIARSGIRESEFAKRMWGEDTRRTIREFEKSGNVQISTLVRICEILDISAEDLLGADNQSKRPIVTGNNNVVNSSHFSYDLASLRAETRTQKLLLDEKDAHIAALKEANNALRLAIQLGQNSDTNHG